MTITDPSLFLAGFLLLSLAANVAQAHVTAKALGVRKLRTDRERFDGAKTVCAPALHAPRESTPGKRLVKLVAGDSRSPRGRRTHGA